MALLKILGVIVGLTFVVAVVSGLLTPYETLERRRREWRKRFRE